MGGQLGDEHHDLSGADHAVQQHLPCPPCRHQDRCPGGLHTARRCVRGDGLPERHEGCGRWVRRSRCQCILQISDECDLASFGTGQCHANFYTRGASSRALWQQVCNDVFGITNEDVGARIQKTNDYYGGKNPANISHVFFSNGHLDAWSLLSVTSYPENNRNVETMVADLGSHCVGLYAPDSGEVVGATNIRKRAIQLFQSWGDLKVAIV